MTEPRECAGGHRTVNVRRLCRSGMSTHRPESQHWLRFVRLSTMDAGAILAHGSHSNSN